MMDSYNNLQNKRMHNADKTQILQFSPLPQDNLFITYLKSILETQNQLDEPFLTSLSHELQLKNVIQSEQISAVTIVLAEKAALYLGIVQSNQPTAKQLLQQSGRVQDLMPIIMSLKKLGLKRKGEGNQIIGWLSKIWDRLIRFSSVKNYIDLLVLYFFIGDLLLQPEQELKRLMKLLIFAVYKLKVIQADTLYLTQELLCALLKSTQSGQYSHEMNVKLKMIQILFLTKTDKIQERELLKIKQNLTDISQTHLRYLIDLQQRSEESGLMREYELIWDKLFSSVLSMYITYDEMKGVCKTIIVQMINYKIDIQTIKLLIRQLEVTNDERPIDKWRSIFEIMSIVLRIYHDTRESLVFLSKKSFFKIPINHRHQFFIQVEFKNCQKTFKEEKMLFMVQDKNRNNQLWVTIRNIAEGQAILVLLRVSKSVIWAKAQSYIKWVQNRSNTFYIQFDQSDIRVSLKNSPDEVLILPKFIDNPSFLVIGDEDGRLGTSIRSLLSLQIYPNRNKDGGECIRFDVLDKNNKLVRKKLLPSFTDLVRAVGDMDIFLMIISHAIKKMKRNEVIVEMIRITIKLLEEFVQIKRVTHQKLAPIQREERLNVILCLCWQAGRESQNALAILELLRVLHIRGGNNSEDQLQILCNFVFWKNFAWQYQKLMIMKIKELFKLLHYQPNYIRLIHRYCQRILLETALYYGEDDGIYMASDKEQILKIHFQFMSLVEEELDEQLKEKVEIDLYYQFMQFLLRLLSCTINRRDSSVDVFDLTFSVQISFFARKLGRSLRDVNVKEQRMLKIIKCIIEVCQIYESEQNYYDCKKIRIYKGQREFECYDVQVIRQNLYFLAYELAALKRSLLYSIILIEEKGISQITCIAWQRQFFDVLVPSKDVSEIVVEQNSKKVQNLKDIYEALPLKCLSYDQTIALAHIYLSQHKLFKGIDVRLTSYIIKVLTIKDLLVVMQSELRIAEVRIKEGSTITASSKVQQISEVTVQDNLLRDKICIILTMCDDLNCQEGLLILKNFDPNHTFFQTQKERFNLLISHYSLKGLAQKTKQMFDKNSTSSIFVSFLIQNEEETVRSFNSSKSEQFIVVQTLSKEQIIRCLDYYFSMITTKDCMVFLKLSNEQEASGHLQNFKINIQCVRNHIAAFQLKSVQKLKNYCHFLEKQLLPLSKYYLQQYKIILPQTQSAKKLKKKSRQFPSFPKFDFKEESKSMYLKFVEERNLNLLKVQKVWSKVVEKNKYFWSAFIGKEVYYSLFQGTGPENQKILLKKDNKKPQLQLPRMLKAGSIRNASICSDKFQFNQSESVSSIFDDAPLYRKEPASCLSLTRQQISHKEINRNKNRFKVLLITSAKIYQGKVTVSEKKLTFVENQTIQSSLYDKIFASQCEKRTEDECIRQNFKFQEELSSKCIAIVKRYLYHDLGVELHTKNRSYFFSFIRADHRQVFLYLLQKEMKVLSRQKLAQEVKMLMQKWQVGLLSNYQYIMRLNDLTGRSFNDLSQYYIFPWTVTNFNSQMTASFLSNRQNFRNLSLPVGKLSKDKWQTIKKRYECKKQERFQTPIPNFLFGSFYSNRAIVCNFLIRVNPFTSQHYQLQSLQFDMPDRLFYSIKDIHQSMMNCPADFKQLIPEFYNFPQFLKNRSYYNLGLRQNKDIVNNVVLPSWARDEYQFIFKMRKILQSEFVTTGLHQWIDLIFGVYAKKQNALKADNLFLGDLYIEAFEKYLCEKDKCSIQLFKEFGQVPIPLLNTNHPSTKFQGNYLDSIIHPTMRIEVCTLNRGMEAGKLLQIYFSKRFTFFLFEKQIRMYEQQKFGQKDYISVAGQFQGGSLRTWQLIDIEGRRHLCLLVHRNKSTELIPYEIRKNIWQNYCFEGSEAIPLKHRCDLFALYDNFMVCCDQKCLYLYKNTKQETTEEYSNTNVSSVFTIGKNKFQLEFCSHFSQHKSRVLQLASNDRGMFISIDEESKVYVTEVSAGSLTIFNYFEIKHIFFEERITEIILHPLSFFLLRTDYGRILAYSFLGDLILVKHIGFAKDGATTLTEKAQTVAIWNQELSEIIIGTNIGNLWKIDLFEMRKMQLITELQVWSQKIHLNQQGFRRECLQKMAINRLGKHSLTLVYAENGKLYMLRSEKWEQARRLQLLGKKVNSFW